MTLIKNGAVLDPSQLTTQVLYNCDVTDAQHAGIYSVCGLAMRLRDLYKWEKRLPPWQEDEPAKVLAWIGEKEERWETLMNASYAPLQINDRSVDAFDAGAINETLIQKGLFYGAGYAHSLKPTFFLAELIGRERIAGHVILILGREHARDLLTLPAFSQDGQAILRTEASRMFLWDQIAYMNNAGRRALDYALKESGLPDGRTGTIKAHFDTLWNIQKTLYVHHEVGHLEDACFDRDTWQEMLADHPHTVVELLIRTLKDILADTSPHGALTHVIQEQDKAALGLYLAFGKGLFPMLCADLVCAFDAFMDNPDWARIERAAARIKQLTADYVLELIDLHAAGRRNGDVATCRAAIEKTMVQRGLLPDASPSAGK